MEAAVSDALRSDEPKVAMSFDCYVVRIKENFGKFYSWSIDVEGLAYEIKESSIVFRNDNEGGIRKSWFPPRNSDEHSGAGNSVSMADTEYELALLNKARVTRVISYLDNVKEICS